jgi:hypothetical protein
LSQCGGESRGELTTGVSERDTAARALEQVDAELALQGDDSAAERRRRHPEARGGAAEVQLVDQHAERAQLTKFDHRPDRTSLRETQCKLP